MQEARIGKDMDQTLGTTYPSQPYSWPNKNITYKNACFSHITQNIMTTTSIQHNLRLNVTAQVETYMRECEVGRYTGWGLGGDGAEFASGLPYSTTP